MANVRSEKIFASSIGSKEKPVLSVFASEIIGAIKDSEGNEVYAKANHQHDNVYTKTEIDSKLENIDVSGDINAHDGSAEAHKSLFEAKADKSALEEVAADLASFKESAGDVSKKDLSDHNVAEDAHANLFAAKADLVHNHDEAYASKSAFELVQTDLSTAKTDIADLKTASEGASNALTAHESSATAHKDLFDSKADADHNHDEVYLKKTDFDDFKTNTTAKLEKELQDHVSEAAVTYAMEAGMDKRISDKIKAEAGSLWKYDAENDEIVPKTKEEIEAKDVGTTNDSIKKLVDGLFESTENTAVNEHENDSEAHAELFAAKADINHTHEGYVSTADFNSAVDRIASNETTLAAKANTSDVNEALGTKVSAEAYTTKVTEIEAALATKADASVVETALSSKVNTEDMNTALAQKADTSTVETALSSKVNTSDMNTALSAKANTSDVNTALAKKANSSDMTTALASKANLNGATFTGDVSIKKLTVSSVLNIPGGQIWIE